MRRGSFNFLWTAIVVASVTAVLSAFLVGFFLFINSSIGDGEEEELVISSADELAERVEKRAEERRKRHEERDRQQRESDEARKAYEAQLPSYEEHRKKREKERRRARQIRRFKWESPADTRGRIWNVPDEETEEALVTALLRVNISEGDGNPQDITGIWQVVKNNRQRTCRRGVVRRITECEEGGGETHLSALRRHQRHVLGKMKARNKRAVWIRNLEPDCEMPKGYTNYLRRRMRRVTEERAQNHWDAGYGATTCPQAVADVRRLVAGKLPESRPGARVTWLKGRPVTWGGRCEEKTGSCDDHMACERVLARIPDTDTENAFWCRIGNTGCRTNPEPHCKKLGHHYARVEYRNRMVWRHMGFNPRNPQKVREPAVKVTEASSEASETPGT